MSDLVLQTENHKRYYCYTYPLTYLPWSIILSSLCLSDWSREAVACDDDAGV